MTSSTIRQYVVAKPRPDQWALIDSANKRLLTLFFSNVRYLLKVRGISQRKMESDIKVRYGFDISRGAAKKYIENPKYVNASLSYLNVYCLYLSESLDSMLSYDYSKYSSL